MTTLPLQRMSPSGIDIHFSDDADVTLRAQISRRLPDPSTTQAPQNSQILKAARQRLVLRLSAGHGLDKSLIAKLFPLKNPSSMLRYKKYARREFLNYIRARKRGIITPRPFAYFQRRRFGLVTGSGLLMEDSHSHRDILQLSRQLPGGYMDASVMAIPALCQLFNAGVHHVDARDENIMIYPTSRDGRDFTIIDWQYASFKAPKADWLLEHLCAYFIRKAPKGMQTDLQANWLGQIYAASGCTTYYETFENRVARLLTASPSTKARLRVDQC